VFISPYVRWGKRGSQNVCRIIIAGHKGIYYLEKRFPLVYNYIGYNLGKGNAMKKALIVLLLLSAFAAGATYQRIVLGELVTSTL
jgi:hypothetical protein